MTINSQWKNILAAEQNKSYFKILTSEITQQRANGETIYPSDHEVFSAFEYVDLTSIKVVILGQDPYHGAGNEGQSQAHGLAFSVKYGIKTPPSLVNIYNELVTDIDGFSTPQHGNLISWAKQGVLLLNTVLTVKESQAHSHAKLGWEVFTDKIISEISAHNNGCVFMLWGAHAQKKGKNIDTDKHYILAGPHPSPLSAYRGFFGCQHFSKANNWLKAHDKKIIDWQV
ncbi:MAG: uracil-DNA glycosylase [Colwellia sp.]|nr:uracil-DNA glycosylase [Colwellia sp.]